MSKMLTNQECSRFLTLLTGKCWHEWEEHKEDWATVVCKICGKKSNSLNDLYGVHPDHLSNPLPVIRWMEKEMSDIFKKYIDHVFFTFDAMTYDECFFYCLDLRNLIDYLWEHTEAPFMWGFTPCPSFPNCMSGETDKCNFPDKGCEGDGKVRGHIHPALQFLRSIKEVRDEK